MSLRLVPDYFFDRFCDASADFLSSIGVKGIVLDVDNTLEPYEHAEPGEEVVCWVNSLKEREIGLAIVSNNNNARIELFNKSLGLFYKAKAKKPFKKNVLLAMNRMGTDKTNTILMGDQIFTDVWAAHNAGIKAILVPPIKDKRDIFTRFKRLLERGIIKKNEKRKI